MTRTGVRVTAALAITLAACSSGAATSPATTDPSTSAASNPATTSESTSTTTTAPTTTTTAPTTTAPTTTAPTTTTTSTTTATGPAAEGDPSYADIPIGVCDTITDGAIGYRNDTGTLANAYEQIGTSFQGRPIWAEHWGPIDGQQVLVLGQVHGDECAPAWFVRAIREQPPTTFGIWLVPTINPDGLAAGTRRTAQDIDPNRDGFRLETPEARAVMEATQRFQPMLTIHTHSPYQWIGSHNGGIATKVANAMMTAVGWPGTYNAGRITTGDKAYLWQGQERVIAGHPSVLIELPAVTEAESPNPPDLSQKDVASVDVVENLAVVLRDTLYSQMS